MEQPVTPEDPFTRLAPDARVNRAFRWRLGVGSAIVLLVLALAAAVVISAVGAERNRSTIGAQTGDAGIAGEEAAGHAGQAAADASQGSGAGVPDATAGRALIFVHVLGAVTNAGLYELTEGARVVDVIAAAGGLADNADPAGVNLARVVSDGEQLYVPAAGEVVAGQSGSAGGSGGGISSGAGGGSGAGSGAGGAGSVKVNLNTASSVELQTLPRIGEAMAQRIIDYRDANGRFASVDDLRNITGIGDKTFEALKDLVTL